MTAAPAPYRSRCDQMGVCQLHRACGSHRACAAQAEHTRNEADDVSPTPPEACLAACGVAAVLLVVLALFVVATVGGSVVLHTFDAQIRQALAHAWEHLASLVWAVLHITS
ncbi:MAG: hypothetical protein ACK5QH_08915 [Rubrivivax sp.]|jgi:hypothetical protein